MPAIALFAAALAQTPPTAPPALTSPTSIEGIWRSPGGNSIIKIEPCGNNRCGKIVWATDKAKKDSSKSTNELVGTQLLTSLQQDKKGRWQGKLFIPDKKLRVTAKIERIGPTELKVSGCAAGKVLCKAAIWTAFATSLPADTSTPAPK